MTRRNILFQLFAPQTMAVSTILQPRRDVFKTPGKVFTLTYSSYNPSSTAIVTLNGLVQCPNVDYTLSGRTLTFMDPVVASLAADVLIQALYWSN